MCGNTFMPDSMTSACRIIWSNLRPMKIGTGSELPDTVKHGTRASPVPHRSEKQPYRCVRMALPVCKPLQGPEIGFRKRQNPLMGNHTSGMTKPRILAFLRLLWLRCLNDKTSHRFQDEDIPDCLQSPIFERREKEKEQLGWLVVWKSAVHPKPIAIARFAAHSTTSAKCKMKPRLESDCISPIGLYSI